MITFTLDGVQVYPAEKQTIVLKDYNPYCEASKGKGAYTYDIDFDLNVGANASAFNWIQKINTGNIPTGRWVRCFLDDNLLFEGEENVLSITGMTAKIQVLCGNSAINFRGNNTRIMDLILPTLEPLNHEQAKNTLSGDLLDESHYHAYFVPVMTQLDKYPYNEDAEKFANFINKDSLWNEGGPSLDNTTKLIPQPSLVWIIEQIVVAMGYEEILYNALRDMPFANKMVVIHGYETLEVKKMIPNWTVSEFLEEVQKLFNVIFNFTEYGSTEIIKVGEYYKNAPTYTIKFENIVDIRSTFERDFVSKEEYLFNYDHISFDFPDSYYYRRAALNKTIQEMCLVGTVRGFENLDTPLASDYNQPIIVNEPDTMTNWIISREAPTANYVYHWERVMQFDPYINDKADNPTETKLRICPAEVFCLDIHPSKNGTYYLMGAGVAYARNKTDKKDEVDEGGLQDWVDGKLPEEEDTSTNKLFVAQVDPKAHVLWSHKGGDATVFNSAYFPQTFVTRYINGIMHAAGATRYSACMDFGAYEPAKIQQMTMDLNVRAKDHFSKEMVIDEQDVLKVKYQASERLNVKMVYIINGQRFICVSNEYTIEDGKLSPFVYGTFLRLVQNVYVHTGEWELFENIKGYDCYRSTNWNESGSVSKVKIEFEKMPDFKIYIDSWAEARYDYVIAFAMDTELPSQESADLDANSVGAVANTAIKQNEPGDIRNYVEVDYPNDGKRHYCWVVFRKDGSVNDNYDRGYIAIPKV